MSKEVKTSEDEGLGESQTLLPQEQLLLAEQIPPLEAEAALLPLGASGLFIP
jgi:hypothetical protein